MSGEAYALGMSGVKHNLPEDFPRPAGFWAEYFGVDVGTVRSWTDKHCIPYRFLGRERFISPSDMMAGLPKIKPKRRDAAE